MFICRIISLICFKKKYIQPRLLFTLFFPKEMFKKGPGTIYIPGAQSQVGFKPKSGFNGSILKYIQFQSPICIAL
jgi:hypothetical protein